MIAKKPDMNTEKLTKTDDKLEDSNKSSKPQENLKKIKEIGGPEGPEPTRYGDWEVGGRCSDF